MKLGLHRAIEKKYAALEKLLRSHLRVGTLKALLETVNLFRVELKEVRAQIDLLRGQHQSHIHRVQEYAECGSTVNYTDTPQATT
jgi:hypothetical protein